MSVERNMSVSWSYAYPVQYYKMYSKNANFYPIYLLI